MLIFRLDARLLRFFEQVAHRFQHWTGKDNFWLGWVFFWMPVVIPASLSISYSKDVSELLVVLLIIGIHIATWLLISSMTKIILKSRMGNWKPGCNTRNPLQISPFATMMRLTGLFAIVLHIIMGMSVVTIISAAFITIAWYLFSCTPLPPGQSKISQLISSLKEALTPSPPVPAGSPA